MGNLKYISEKFDSCLNTYRETFTDQSKIPSNGSGSIQQYDNSVILPLDFSLEMDGISGIIPNSAFEVPPEVLPKSYLTQKGESKIGFILHTIDHNFNNNKWTTKITGQTINLRFDPLSAEEVARREANKAQTSNDIIAAENAANNSNFPNPIQTKGCTKDAVSLLKSPTATANIKLITDALKTVGITNKNAVASIIAISGGETRLKPRAEDHVYKTVKGLRGAFSGLTTDQETRATAKGITKKEFFNIVYGEYNKGRIGNKNVSDGGLYYGRGYNQLTGRGNYEATNNALIKRFGIKDNILKNPDRMNDPAIAAKALAIFYVDVVKIDQNDANYFKKALVKTGHDAHGGYQRKTDYHACLMSNDFQNPFV
jgi:predicted chitinase